MDNIEPRQKLGPKSAFKLVYLGAFVWAIVQQFTIVSSSLRVRIIEEIPEGVQLTSVDQTSANALIIAVVAIISVHLMRIYITLELLEEQSLQYQKFYEGMGPGTAFFEFLFRVAIVVLVTLKAIDLFNWSLFQHLTFLYVTFTLWSGLMLFAAGKSWNESFMTSSLGGVIVSIALWNGFHPDALETTIVFTIICVGAIAAIAIDLVLHLKDKRLYAGVERRQIVIYFLHYWRIISNWRVTKV